MLRTFALALLVLSARAPRADALVEYRTFQVKPDTLRVGAGTTVRWVNHDQVMHTVTGGTPQEPGTGWRTVLAREGTSTTRTFKAPGTYRYFCDRHPFMTGTIIVTPTTR
jgi:plastocyanin